MTDSAMKAVEEGAPLARVRVFENEGIPALAMDPGMWEHILGALGHEMLDGCKVCNSFVQALTQAWPLKWVQEPKGYMLRWEREP